MIGKPVAISIVEVRTPDTNAQLVAENIAQQLEKRISYRRAMKNAMGRAMRMGAKGIKVMCSGRLGGREIAGVEQYHDGTIPLQTIRADIEYGFAEAATTYGRIGVKVWIYKGEVLSQTLRTTPRVMDMNKPQGERRRRDDRRGGRNGDRRQGGYNRDRQQNGERRQGGYGQRPAGQGGYNRGPRPASSRKGRRQQLMLMPKRVKYRRVHRGRMKGKATRGNFVAYGEFGLSGHRAELDHQPTRSRQLVLL